jgi:capsular exopolysaccharide synthesis family protein
LVEFREYIAVFRKYWVSIALLTVAGVLGALGYVMYATPVYTASSTVWLSVYSGDSVSDLVQGNNYANSQARSFAELASTPYVLDPVLTRLQLPQSVQDLGRQVTATVATNTSLVTVSVRDKDAATSARIADAVAASLVDSVEALSPTTPTDGRVVVGQIVTPAVQPASPTSPQLLRSLALGLVVGLAVGAGAAIIRKSLDVRLHSSRDITGLTDHPVLATIPHDPAMVREPVVMLAAPSSVIGERFRQLRTNLRFLDIDNDSSPNFVITSSIEGEGKTVTAINVAYALAEGGDRVLLIDADLRRPRVAAYLHLEGSAGLTTVLANRAGLNDVVQTLGPGSPDVLASGTIPPNPAELVGSRRMKQLLEQVSSEYQAVVIDAAPLLPVADTLLLLPHVSGTVMVAAAEKVTLPQLKSALEAIERTNAHVMGILVNQARRRSGGHEYYGYSYNTTGQGPKGRGGPKRARG